MEVLYHLAMRLGGGALAVCVPLAGPRLGLDRLGRALLRVVPAHPLLFASIRPSPDHPTIPAWCPRSPLPDAAALFTCREETGGGSVTTAMERCLRIRYGVEDDRARMNCILLRQPDGADGMDCLLFGLHHLFFDGEGFHAWLGRLLSALSEEGDGAPGPVAAPASFPASDWEMTLKLWSERMGEAPLPAPAFTACSSTSRVLSPPRTPLGRLLPPLALLARILPSAVVRRGVGRGIHVFTLDPPQTSAFLAACRARALRPAAALVGAFGRAVREAGCREDLPYVPALPVNLRNLLAEDDVELRRSMASGIAGFVCELAVPDGATAWEVASAWQGKFGEGLGLAEHLASWTWARRWMERHDVLDWPHPLESSVLLSNVGVLDEVINAPANRWQARHIFVAGFEQAFTLLSATLDGRFSVTLSHPVPPWSRATGAAVADSLRRFLLSAA